jgi:hypothetical protein
VRARIANDSGYIFWAEVREVVAWSENGVYVRKEYRSEDVHYVPNKDLELTLFDQEALRELFI